MCLICVEFQKQRMTIPEARRALGEMRKDEHTKEVSKMLDDEEAKDD